MKTTTAPRDRLYRAYWQDGSIDLFAGFGLLAIGVGWLFDQIVFSAVIPALTVPMWSVFRTRFVAPRLGYVKFDPPRQRQMRTGHLVLLGLGVLSFGLGIAAFMFFESGGLLREWTERLVPGLPAILVGIGGIAAGFLFNMHRLALYGLACMVFGLASALLGLHPGWPLLIGGVVPTLAGAVLLLRFFRAYSLLPTEPQ